MDEVTQQNSALVEENAATAKTLEHQSKAMNDEVSVFRVDEMDRQGAPARPAAAAKPAAKPVAGEKPAAAKPPAKAAAPAAEIKAARPAAVADGGVAAPARGGPVGRMQAALATAVAVADPQWQEF
jgi:hypothetical protein